VIGTVMAVLVLVLVALYLLAGAALAVLTSDRARRPIPVRDALALAGGRALLAVAVAGIAVWVVITR
jgi:hypothetical protein